MQNAYLTPEERNYSTIRRTIDSKAFVKLFQKEFNVKSSTSSSFLSPLFSIDYVIYL